MKLTCPTAALLTACQIARGAIAGRTTKPILNCVKVVTGDESLTVMATDLEVGIRYELRGVRIQRPGTAILPVGRLIAILRETNDAEVVIDGGESKIIVRLTDGKYELPSQDPEEFPDVPEINAGHFAEVPGNALAMMLRRTVFAAEHHENTRYAVTGVLLEFEEGKLRAVATDTKRLAVTVGPAEITGDAGRGLIPVKAIRLLESNIADGERVRISLKPNEAYFQTERATIHTRLVEGKFPPYEQFMPKTTVVKITLPVAEFTAKIRRAAVTAEATKRLDFRLEPGKLTVEAFGKEIGESQVEMLIPDFDGEGFEIAFDHSYLLEMLKAIEGEPTVILEMNRDYTRFIFSVGENYRYLVVPMVG